MIKTILINLFILFSIQLLAAGGEEEQRKYIFDNPSVEFDQFIIDGQLAGLKSSYHSEFEYLDIYLDTSELDLFNNQLSLRLRKRDFGNGIIEYGIQLKSEMIEHGAVRMEVEEDDIDFYNIVIDSKVVKLKTVLDDLYSRFLSLTASAAQNVDISQDPVLSDLIQKIEVWLNFKIDAAIEPFIKLNRLNLDKSRLKNLSPVIIGKSVRKRSHILKTNNDEWVMETSFDTAKFYSLTSPIEPHVINEYEVENKHKVQEQGRVYMNNFEDGIIERFDAKINLDSKYRQTIKMFMLK